MNRAANAAAPLNEVLDVSDEHATAIKKCCSEAFESQPTGNLKAAVNSYDGVVGIVSARSVPQLRITISRQAFVAYIMQELLCMGTCQRKFVQTSSARRVRPDGMWWSADLLAQE